VSGPAFVLRMAAREIRAAPRRLLLLTGSIAVGVAALVSIDSFTDNLRDSVRGQARALLGADLALSSRRPLPKAAAAVLDTLAVGGGRVARLTSFSGMAYVPRTSGTRLVQVAAVEQGYPFYGEIRTAPAAAWRELQRGGRVVVDPSLLTALLARVGDTLALGEARFVISGTVVSAPGNVGVRAAFGPRIYIPADDLPATRLLGFGSRAEYEAYVRLPASASPQALAERFRPRLLPERVRVRTVAEDQENLNDALGRLTGYLGLVALIALLLGGIGVASGVVVFIRQRLDTIAVLRCLGASAGRVLAVYAVEAAAMGLAGSIVGAAVGVLAQRLLPALLAGLLPVDVQAVVSPRAVALGLGMGLWVALVFALPPLLAVRRVPPRAAQRRDVCLL
jgi:putative ABC transport system permease protein